MQQAVPPGTPPVLHGYTHCRNTILCRYCSTISLPSLFVCLWFSFFLITFSRCILSSSSYFVPFFYLPQPFLLSFFPLFSLPCLSTASFLYLSFLSPTVPLFLCPSFFMAFLRIQDQNTVLRFPASVKSVTEGRKKFSTPKGTTIAPFTGEGQKI